MSIRSPRLLGVAFACLAAAAALGILYHDGVLGVDERFELDDVGETARFRGEAGALSPYLQSHLRHHLDLHSILVDTGEGLYVVTTSPEPLPERGVLLVEGTVIHGEPFRDGLLLVLQASAAHEPLVAA
ncbi:MAG: hypothetical protein ACPGQL_07350 [Thermoplasmatota archaeon]